MIYQVIQPAPHLRTFIKNYVLLHFVFDENATIPVKPFPANAEHNIVFYLRGRVTAFDPGSGLSKIFPKISVNGSQISRFDFHLSTDYLLLSINFQPGVLFKFLRCPLTGFTNERIDAEAILNPEILKVYERMANVRSYESIIPIIEDYLWKRIQSLKMDFFPIDKVIHLITENPTVLPVEELAGYACLSISQFERRFVQQMGITPKFFARINRFYRAYTLKEKRPDLNWLGIAFQTGYYDYQHLVKDFKEFAYTMPNSLIQEQAQSPERVLGLE